LIKQSPILAQIEKRHTGQTVGQRIVAAESRYYDPKAQRAQAKAVERLGKANKLAGGDVKDWQKILKSSRDDFTATRGYHDNENDM
jgi:hypothetical protein